VVYFANSMYLVKRVTRFIRDEEEKSSTGGGGAS
jgi:hypothetical protein